MGFMTPSVPFAERRNIHMKKVILNIGIIIATIVTLLGVLYFFNGSLEMYPTEEQIEKAKIGASVIIMVGLVADIVLIRLASKYKR